MVCITANDDVMKCEGEATIRVKSDDGKTAVIDALVSSECKDEMLVSWHDLVALSVLPKDFPRALDVQGTACAKINNRGGHGSPQERVRRRVVGQAEARQ